MSWHDISQKVVDRMRELRTAGWSYGQISNEVSISKMTVRRYCRDIPCEHQGRVPEERVSQMRALRATGLGVVEVARRCGVSHSTVSNYCKEPKTTEPHPSGDSKPAPERLPEPEDHKVEHPCKICWGVVRFRRCDATAACDICGQTFDRGAFPERTARATGGTRPGRLPKGSDNLRPLY